MPAMTRAERTIARPAIALNIAALPDSIWRGEPPALMYWNAPHIRKKAATVTATPSPMLSRFEKSMLIASTRCLPTDRAVGPVGPGRRRSGRGAAETARGWPSARAGRPAGAGEVGPPEAGEDRHLADDVALDRRVDHPAVADVDPDVRDRLERGVGVGEEDQVAGPQLDRRDPDGRVVLRLGGPRQLDADLTVRPLDEARAVEGRAGARAAPDVRHPEVLPRDQDDAVGRAGTAGRSGTAADGRHARRRGALRGGQAGRQQRDAARDHESGRDRDRQHKPGHHLRGVAAEVGKQQPDEPTRDHDDRLKPGRTSRTAAGSGR